MKKPVIGVNWDVCSSSGREGKRDVKRLTVGRVRGSQSENVCYSLSVCMITERGDREPGAWCEAGQCVL